MKTKALKLCAILTLITLFLGTMPGCVTYTSVKDEPRQRVRFGSAQAAQTFYEAYLGAAHPHEKHSLAIGIHLPYQHRKVSTENVRFNAAVQAADRNRDGVISQKEALSYARSRADALKATGDSAPPKTGGH